MELNKEQVVKALEKWMKNYDGKVTNFVTLGNAIGLIEELVEENERLQNLVKELQQYNEAWVEDNGKLRQGMKTLKTDTVQKMRAMLKERSFRDVPVFGEPYSCVDFVIIDQVAKELLEESK